MSARAVPAELEQRVIALVGERRAVQLYELEGCIGEIRNLISEGRLRLTVVQCAWGIEFDVEIGPLNREGLYEAR